MDAITAETFLADPTAHLAHFDVIVVNHSGGKDSTVALWEVYEQAQRAGVTDRIIVLHNDLGRVEWPSTADLDADHADHYRRALGGTLTGLLGDRPSARGIAQAQADAHGLPFAVYSRTGGDLLQQIEQYGKFPDASNRHCTSEQKRGPKHRLFTAVTNDKDLDRKVRILDVNGERGDESTARARKDAFEPRRGLHPAVPRPGPAARRAGPQRRDRTAVPPPAALRPLRPAAAPPPDGSAAGLDPGAKYL